jgi:hypothetical protein
VNSKKYQRCKQSTFDQQQKKYEKSETEIIFKMQADHNHRTPTTETTGQKDQNTEKRENKTERKYQNTKYK